MVWDKFEESINKLISAFKENAMEKGEGGYLCFEVKNKEVYDYHINSVLRKIKDAWDKQENFVKLDINYKINGNKIIIYGFGIEL